MSGRRIGVYVCHCGGNISDYVDVGAVIDAIKDEPDVVVAREAMFTCSDATQQEIIADIAGQHLDGLVVASCSPKLHTFTFRDVARRAGLNPYEYTQVNIREQCSWAHTDDADGATRKAIRLVRAGTAGTRTSVALEPTTVETTQRVLVIGGGVTGMRAAIGLADIGLGVVLVEREEALGGHVGDLGAMFPHAKTGVALIGRLRQEIAGRPAITVFTSAELAARSGTYGNYHVVVRTPGGAVELDVGQIVVATGFESYQPPVGEHGYGTAGVLTLPELEQLLDQGDGPLVYGGKAVASIAYIYCVGSREAAHSYCSRFCCSAAVHMSLRVAERVPSARQYHLYREMRTYGRNEEMLSESRQRGSVYIKFADDEPPRVDSANRQTSVTVRDLLTAGEELTVAVDLVVLVTGMVPRPNEELVGVLKLPVGQDGFFNEIHPKLRPVETVVDGALICGTCQGPKTSAESVASGLAAVAQVAAVLKRGVAELDPQVAIVTASTCDGCGMCVDACPFAAITMMGEDGARFAAIDPTGCKGCGACVPVCPVDAIDLAGYTDARIRGMIDALATGPAR
jgi:heterodisulfide reductase subunit A